MTVKPVRQFDPERDLGKPLDKNRPRVLVLSNVPELTTEQRDGITRFLDEGGGVLVMLGDRVNARAYNEDLYREGRRLVAGPAGREAGSRGRGQQRRPGSASAAIELQPSRLAAIARRRSVAGPGTGPLPALVEGDGAARCREGGGAVTAASLTNNDPLLVERPQGKGRVLLCTVPLDDSWSPNLLSQWEYPLLAHELVSYLAGARSGEHNLLPGQPLQYQPLEEEPTGTVLLQPPTGDVKSLRVDEWPLTYTDTREPGIYRLTTPSGRTIHYVVEPDPSESELAPSSDSDRDKVSQAMPLKYETNRDAILFGPGKELELWWWFLFGVIGLLCCEVWMTRRMAKNARP